MREKIHRPYRYDFFTIWGNGLSNTKSILEILRSEDNLQLIRIESMNVKNMKKFVFNLYACDPVPIKHLRSKLKYLFKAKPEIIIVYVKNLAPEENYFGEGAFRHIQCGYIKGIKEKIRDLYNPRINGIRTEEHVIHASDYEEQVDYFLKMVGHPEGIKYLHEDNSILPFSKPYHIPYPNTYIFKTLTFNDLRASILIDASSSRIKTEFTEIDQTPHFRSLQNGGTEYREYLKRFRYTLLTDNHSWDGLLQMNQLSDNQIKDFDPILVTPIADSFRILDGVHRAAVTLNHQQDTIKCVVISYE